MSLLHPVATPGWPPGPRPGPRRWPRRPGYGPGTFTGAIEPLPDHADTVRTPGWMQEVPDEYDSPTRRQADDRARARCLRRRVQLERRHRAAATAGVHRHRPAQSAAG